MFSDSDRAALEKRFASLVEPITLLVVADDGVLSEQLSELANALASTNQKIKVEALAADGGRNPRMKELRIDHWPVLLPSRPDFARIRYYGVPAGYEIAPMVEGIVELSTSKTGLSPKAREALQQPRNAATRRLPLDRDRNGVLVVLDQEEHRKPFQAGGVHCLPELALAGCAVTGGDQRDLIVFGIQVSGSMGAAHSLKELGARRRGAGDDVQVA